MYKQMFKSVKKSLKSRLLALAANESVFSYSGPHFPPFRNGCGEIRSISLYSVRMRENADQNNSKYGHFSRSGLLAGRVLFIAYS